MPVVGPVWRFLRRQASHAFVAPLNAPAIRRQHQDLRRAWQAVRHPVAPAADLVLRAVRLAESPAVRADLRARWSWVLVD